MPNYDVKEPKTRKETKGSKDKDKDRGPYSAKHVRIAEALKDKTKSKK